MLAGSLLPEGNIGVAPIHVQARYPTGYKVEQQTRLYTGAGHI